MKNNIIVKICTMVALVVGASSIHAAPPVQVNLPATCTAHNASQVAVVPPAYSALSVTCDEASTGPVTPPGVVPPCTVSSGDYNLTRQCVGNVRYSYSAPPYGGILSTYQQVEGLFPGAPMYLGQTVIVGLQTHGFVSFGFIAPTDQNPVTVKWTANTSWGGGGAISVSQKPGQFAGLALHCSQMGGGSNSMIFGVTPNNTYCKLTPGQLYYVNLANVDQNGNPITCSAGTCNLAYTVLVVNGKPSANPK